MKDKKYTFSHTILLTFCILILTLFSAIDVNAENESETAGASLGKPASYYEDNMVSTFSAKVAGWHLNSTGWWYEYSDGSWPANSWRKIDGKWHYFNSSGYWVDDNRHETGSLKGMDVSAWQGSIDWKAVKDDGIQFAFIRIGHGTHTIDTYYQRNMAEATKNEIPVGVYFYSTALTPNTAVLDARFVIENLKGYKVSYPVVIDLEDKVQNGLSKTQIGIIARAYCDEIRKAGYTPMIYMNEYWHSTKIDHSQIQGIDKWIARYNGTYNESISRNIWQCCSTGKINGVNGRVDIDFGYKDYTKYITPRTAPVSNYYTSRVPIGWVKNLTGWWYSNYDGSYLKNTWSYLSGHWYYFNVQGYMVTGWQFIDNNWYYMDGNGVMKTGWQFINNRWYYMNSSGAMKTGWQAIGGKWYYLDPSGAMKTGWQAIGGKWYYLDASGAMKTGWLLLGNTWYYLNRSGVMLTGTHTINGAKYTFNSSGAMI